MNQIEASYWKKNGTYGNKTLIDEWMNEYIGSQEIDFIGMSYITEYTGQDCKRAVEHVDERGADAQALQHQGTPPPPSKNRNVRGGNRVQLGLNRDPIGPIGWHSCN